MYQGYNNNPYFYPFNPPVEYGYNDLYRSNQYQSFYGVYPIPCYYVPTYNSYNYRMNNNMPSPMHQQEMELKDYGPNPTALDIHDATNRNENFRLGLWTGNHLQVTLMSLMPGEDIGVEMHPNVDQFLRVEQGQGITEMGNSKNNLPYKRNINEDSAIMVPAGTWHNITNTGVEPLKLYSIYAPPNHPKGVLHETKADAEAAEKNLG